LLYAWPGAVYEENGTMQAVIDAAHADEVQRRALATVLHGGETQEAKTHWRAFHAMSTTMHEPIFVPIQFEVDIEARTAQVSIPGVLTSSGRPIVSPATGEEHRVRIDIPNGIEFEIAEIGSASTNATGPIQLDLDDTYGQFNRVRHSPVRVLSAALTACGDAAPGRVMAGLGHLRAMPKESFSGKVAPTPDLCALALDWVGSVARRFRYQFF
jgi:hypothetical protein